MVQEKEVVGVGDTNTSAAKLNTIDYITISTTGNATDFGDLTAEIGLVLVVLVMEHQNK